MFTAARLIAPAASITSAPRLRGVLRLDTGHGPVESAVIRYSALGLVEARVAGQPVSPDALTPGWSSYEWRVRVAENDVTALVSAAGEEVEVELTLGNGWYRGDLTWMGATAVYGDRIAGIAEIAVTFADGHRQTWGTGPEWDAYPSEVLANDLYQGQTIDARRRSHTFEAPLAVEVVDDDLARFEPYVGPPVRRQQEVPFVDAWLSPTGTILVDFGQNLVGWLRASVRGRAGAMVTIRHAEVLENGLPATRALRSASATDRFILSGGDDEFEPTLTFHGFRYAEIEGWPGGVEALRRSGGLVAVVIGSELRRTGTFRSSHDGLNRLHENVVWSTRGNFVDVPTDCPQRDERLGWTGDIAVFAPTGAFLFDVDDFLRDWLRDLAVEQRHQNGIVPYVVPDVLKKVGYPPEFVPIESTALWSDAVAWVPWALWLSRADRRVLEETFDPMLAHVRHVEGLLSPSGLWDEGFQFGDWLDPDAPPEYPAQAKARTDLVATASFHRTVDIAANTALVLGRDADHAELVALRDRVRDAFRGAFVEGGSGRLTNECTTSYSLAIVFGLLDDGELAGAGDRLAELVRDSGDHISTGFAGTPFILDALSATGHIERAGRLLLQTECPSWLYPVEMGATTIWERWDSMLPDGSINPGEMTSFNHYALGAVADWMHRVLGGLAPAEPGYRRVTVAPQPIDGVDWVETEFASPHGPIAVSWRREGAGVILDVSVPPGVIADVRMPGLERTVEAGVHRFSVPFAPARV